MAEATRAAFRQAVEHDDVLETEKMLQRDNSLVNARYDDWQHTALHIASKRGHVAMCHILLEFGADKESVDVFNRTPFLLATLDGHVPVIQFLKSAQCNVEARDKDAQHTALHIASKNGCVGTCHVLLEFGVDKESVDYLNRTPFLMAAWNGHVSVMQLLKSAQCNVEARNKYNNGALGLASMCGHVSAVEFLIKSGHNVDERQENGRTPFLIAARWGHVPLLKSLKSVQCNVEARDNDGNGALALASKYGDVVAVEFLIKDGHSVNEKHEKGRTSLHFAGSEEHVRVIKILLENKADAGVVDEDGKRPYNLATGDLKSMLRKAYDDQMYAVFQSEGTVEPSLMKLCVIGSEGSGKTTFTESVKRSWLWSLFADWNQLYNPYCMDQRTVGIDVSTADVSGVGRVVVYDAAGQNQFHKTHGFFFAANAFFILLLSLVTGGKIRALHELFEEAKYWLCFLRASIKKRSIPTVIMAASHLDLCSQGKEILQQVADHLRRVFAGKIVISSNTFALDCRKRRSPEMSGFMQHLGDLKKQNKVLYPRLCEPVVTTVLPALRQQQQDLFIDTSQLVAAIKKQSPMQDQATIDKVISFLDDCAELMEFGELSILDIPCLCMFILGPLMAPENFPYHLEGKHDGIVKKEDILHVLEAFRSSHNKPFTFNIDTISHLLEALELMFAVEGRKGVFLFPCHLPIKKLIDMWGKDPRMAVYVGRQACCICRTSIFSPGVFSLLQCRASVRLDKQAQLWQNGIIVTRAETVRSYVQCLVRMSESLEAVDFVCRSAKGSETDCMSLLSDVMALWKDVINEHSPGTEYEVGYMSRQHLTEHWEEVAVYSQEQVDEAKEKGPKAAVHKVTRQNLVIVESLSDLMVFITPRPARAQYPSAEAFSAVFQAIVSYGQAQWYELALAVGFNTSKIDSLTYNKAMDSGKLLAIIQCRIDEVGIQAAEEAFLQVCQHIPHSIHGAVMDELQSQQQRDQSG